VDESEQNQVEYDDIVQVNGPYNELCFVAAAKSYIKQR